MTKATFGAGCFWHVEEAFRKLEGVTNTEVGFEGGHLENPSYEEVCTHETGHAEVVRVEFDPGRIAYNQLLDVFFDIHDPTQKDRQGLDIGSQYRSVIFYHSDEQRITAEEKIRELEKSGKYRRKIVTELSPSKIFYRAEEYHQKYLAKRGRFSCG